MPPSFYYRKTDDKSLRGEPYPLRAEIERLRKILASNGLTSASALTHRHNSDLPAVPKQQEDRQERIDMKMCNRCASLVRSSILNKLNSFSGIDFTLAFRSGSGSAAFVAECCSIRTQGPRVAYLVGFLLVPGG